MSRRNLIIIAGAACLLILILLAVLLRGRAQEIVLGLLFIGGFVAVFGGSILGVNAMKERYFTLPRHPTHVCPHCYSLYDRPEGGECSYCLESFGLPKTLQNLDAFLAEHAANDLQAETTRLETELKRALGRNILFIEHDLKNLRRLSRLQAARNGEHAGPTA